MCVFLLVLTAAAVAVGAAAGKPTAEQLGRVRTRKPAPPVLEVHLADGSVEPLWCTFSDQQVGFRGTKEECSGSKVGAPGSFPPRAGGLADWGQRRPVVRALLLCVTHSTAASCKPSCD